MNKTTYSIAKAFHHVNTANEYFMDIQRETTGNVKHLFKQYQQKLDFIINDMKYNLSDRSREILKREMEVSFNIEAINDKLCHLEAHQLDEVETYIDKILTP